jgi:RHS repeat-associated protein
VAGVVVALCLPAVAAAEPVCTDTWTGPAEGKWAEGSHWSLGHVPSASDVACVGSGKTVEVIEAPTAVAGVLSGEGTVVLHEGTLEVKSALEASNIKALKIKFAGVLKGAATLDVTGTLTWEAGEMAGSGSTILKSGATGTISGNTHLETRSLVNEGTLTIASGSLTLEVGGMVSNSGTVNDNDTTGSGVTKGPGTPGSVTNTGTWRKTEGSGQTLVEPSFANEGTVSAEAGKIEFRGGGTSGTSHTGSWSASAGAEILLAEGTYSLGAKVPMSGAIMMTDDGGEGAHVTAGVLEGPTAKITIIRRSAFKVSSLELTGSGESTIKSLTVGADGTLRGSAKLDVTESLTWEDGTIEGTGRTRLAAGATGTISLGAWLEEALFINEGTLTWSASFIAMKKNAVFENYGIFIANGSSMGGLAATEGLFKNFDRFEKTTSVESVTVIDAAFENNGAIDQRAGTFKFERLIEPLSAENVFGGHNHHERFRQERSPQLGGCECYDPVNVGNGNLVETQTDLDTLGRGPTLTLTRTYNAQLAANGHGGAFGLGWTNTWGDYILIEGTHAKVHEANGAITEFTESEGKWTGPRWSQTILSGSEAEGYTLTYPNQTKLKFAGHTAEGEEAHRHRLESETDRNGNALTLTYNGSNAIEVATDASGRKLTFKYNGEGHVETVEAAGRTAKYGYSGGELSTVTLPGETEARWSFKYDASHRMTELTDGRGGHTKNEYDEQNRVSKQTDPAEHVIEFTYLPLQTKVTAASTGAVTNYSFNAKFEPTGITRGYGTANATSERRTYDAAGDITELVDGNGHSTTYEYENFNRTKVVDPNGHETKWGYNSTHDVTSVTTPRGETTTIKRDAHGNVELIERPAPGEKIQTTHYKYTAQGQLKEVEDPLKHISTYEYDTHGALEAETDPEGDKRTWSNDESGYPKSTVSPRGNAEGAEPAKYTTKIERDEQERPIKITDPLGHTTKYAYDRNGNLEALTDANEHTTTYTYNADNQATKVKQPNGDSTETEYDGEGHVTAQIDGNKHTTKYKRNILGQVAEVEDPLKHVTKKEYDAAGNLSKLEDPAKRTTTYTYDAANQLKEVSYSEAGTHAVKYEYDEDGNRTKMEDGTGTSKYSYDQLDRLTETKDGHGNVVKYEYDLANQQKMLTYPNGKTVTREYDKAGRLESIKDWLEHTTSFSYDQDSNQTKTTFPGNEDKTTYNEADQLTKTEMKKGAETLAKLTYSRDNLGQLKTTEQTGLPGEAETKYTYDENNRLTKAGATEYKYDAADNPTTIGASTQTFNEGNELTKGAGVEYSYSELGERTKRTPTEGPATTYTYDQASNLTKVERPKEGETAEIKDSYEYDGSGLRTSQTISGTTSYFAWDQSGGLPLLLTDGTNSYLYGPSGEPVEQISGAGAALYLHHDQQGSTRMLTSVAGAKEASTTYNAYGSTIGTTGTATTPLGYDSQYASSDTGQIYLRARTYDPATAQFMTVDPMRKVTRAPYDYALDDPTNLSDPTGLFEAGKVGGSIPCDIEEELRRQQEEREVREEAERTRRELQRCGRVYASYGSNPCSLPEGEGPQTDEPPHGPVVPPPNYPPGSPGLKIPTPPYGEGAPAPGAGGVLEPLPT